MSRTWHNTAGVGPRRRTSTQPTALTGFRSPAPENPGGGSLAGSAPWSIAPSPQAVRGPQTATRVLDAPATSRADTDLPSGRLLRALLREAPAAEPANVVIEFPDGATGASTAAPVHPLRDRARTPRVSVVIPTYNEAKNLPGIMSRIPGEYEVVVVDGRSVDDTVEVARSLRPDATIVLQNRRGKGNAMSCGFAAVTGDIVVMLDADGSAAPEEISRFVDALLAGADFAKGSRFAPGGGSADITPLRAWGNGWLNRLANLLFGTQYTDLCYGYNAFWRDCLDELELDPRPDHGGDKRWGDGFEIETIINTRMAKSGMRITEVPSFEFARVHGESNLNTWRDGARVLWALLVERTNGVARRERNIARPVPIAGDVVPTPRAPHREEAQTA